jgi:hypothetical protein
MVDGAALQCEDKKNEVERGTNSISNFDHHNWYMKGLSVVHMRAQVEAL